MRHSPGTVQTTTCVGESVTDPAGCLSSDFPMYFSHWTNMSLPIQAWIFITVNCANTRGKGNYYCPLGGENKKEAGTLNERSPGDRRLHDSDLQAEEKLLQEARWGMPQVSIWLSGKWPQYWGFQASLRILVSLTWESSSDDLSPSSGPHRQVLTLYIHIIFDWDFSQAPLRHTQHFRTASHFPAAGQPRAASAPAAVCCPHPLMLPLRIPSWTLSRSAGECAPFRRGLVPQLLLTFSLLNQTQPR